MSESIHLDLTASFVHVSGATPFGSYDSNTQFQSDANSLVKLANSKLGGSVLEVELNNKDVYASFEEAVLEYSALVNSYHAKSILADIIGSPTGSLSGSQNKVARLNLALAKRRADAYGTEALVGGTKTLYSSSIDLTAGHQVYDLKVILSSSNEILDGERAEIREVFHFSPTAAYRFFDTSSAINYLHNEFSFESFTPETIFYLLPIWEDVLRAQQLEMSHRIRRSNYSYNLVNNVLKIYPVPSSDVTLYFTYFKVSATDDPFDGSDDPLVNGVANLSNVPFGNLNYSQINSMGKQWIRKYALALVKESLGHVRGKMEEIPIPNGSLSLNGPQLINDGRQEQLQLKEELKMLLESTTYAELAKQEAEQSRMLLAQLGGIPLGIFCG